MLCAISFLIYPSIQPQLWLVRLFLWKSLSLSHRRLQFRQSPHSFPQPGFSAGAISAIREGRIMTRFWAMCDSLSPVPPEKGSWAFSSWYTEPFMLKEMKGLEGSEQFLDFSLKVFHWYHRIIQLRLHVLFEKQIEYYALRNFSFNHSIW